MIALFALGSTVSATPQYALAVEAVPENASQNRYGRGWAYATQGIEKIMDGVWRILCQQTPMPHVRATAMDGNVNEGTLKKRTSVC